MVVLYNWVLGIWGVVLYNCFLFYLDTEGGGFREVVVFEVV